MPTHYPNRRSIRLCGYDYSQHGLYFITICTYKREYLFGKIDNGEMILNAAGEIAHNCWLETEQIRPNIVLGEFVVMPNHVHAVFAITRTGELCTGVSHTPEINLDESHTAVSHTSVLNICDNPAGVCNTPLRSPSQTVGAVVRGYKSSVSKRIGFSVWQRNYYEHIIRNQTAYERISQYIIDNPARWKDDCFY